MRYLITGATGLIGSALVDQCHALGIGVNYLTTSQDKIDSKENYQGFYWNPQKGEIDLDCFRDVTKVINLAGASISNRWTDAYKKKIISSRIDSLSTLYKGIKDTSNTEIKTFVSASAIGLYPHSFEKYYDETTTSVDDSFLGEVVERWEVETDKFRALDLNVAKVRIGLALASEGGALPQMAKPVRLYAGAAFGTGEQWQSWIHIEDLARVFLFIAENDFEGAFNGVAPNPVTQKKLIKEIAEVLSRPLFLPNIPKFLVKLLLGEMSYLVLASQRVSSNKLEKHGFSFLYPNISGALHAIYSAKKQQESNSFHFSKEISS